MLAGDVVSEEHVDEVSELLAELPEDAEWDAATFRSHTLGESDERGTSSRALCESCSAPLHRFAEASFLARFNIFAACRSNDCALCGEGILDGELHFVCKQCELPVCKSCGPGSCIDRDYDFVDFQADEQSIKQMNAKVIHKRKGKRGMDVDKHAEAKRVAQVVITGARDLIAAVREEEADCFDKDWAPDGVSAMEWLFGGESMSADVQLESMSPDVVADVLLLLANTAHAILEEQQVLSEVAVPCKVFGDLHGQLRDLLILLDRYGMPGGGTSFVWNGDFVDRGSHQVEALGLLLAFKVAYPDAVWLNRGNHEDATMNAKYGFQEACSAAVGARGDEVYAAFQKVFDWLPLGSLVGGRILVVHGGVGDGQWSLEALRRVQRPLDHRDLMNTDWIWNILWSDPIEEDGLGGATFGVHDSPRGKASKRFGWNVTQAFCAKEGLDMVIRSHQVKKAGYGFDVMHDDSLMRVFSARDYEKNGNDAAVLSVALAEGEELGGLLTLRAQVLRSLTKSAKAAKGK